MNATGLIKKLAGLLRNPPDKSRLFEYHRRIKKLNLTPAQTENLSELIVGRFTFFPTVAEILECANELRRLDAADRKDIHWLTFDHGGRRYAMRCHDPARPPELPVGAGNPHLVIDRPIDADEYQPCTPEEARAAFRQGYLEAGGDPRQLRELMGSITPDPEPECEEEVPF